MEDIRRNQLTAWLESVLEQRPLNVTIASADASFRRYFRVESHGKTWIAMDAPPDKEDCQPFIDVAKAFNSVKMNVPEICAEDLAQGFLLLTDFGDINFLDVLNENRANADRLYGDAMQALLSLQLNPKPDDFILPHYDDALLSREIQLFPDWFLEKHLQLTLDESETAALNKVYKVLTESALSQEQVWVHRDYHSRNLMVLENNNPGVIDFQDAVHGPITYDLVSLLRDCYIDWPIDQTEAWVESYLQLLKARNICENISSETFLRWFDLMGVQRHLKVLGIFCRLNYRDGKSGYLNDLPRTLMYVQQVSEKYEELAVLNTLITNRIMPLMTKVMTNTMTKATNKK